MSRSPASNGRLDIVFPVSVFDALSGIAHQQKPALIQAFVADLPLKLSIQSFCRSLPEPDEACVRRLDACLFIQHLAGKLRVTSDGDGFRQPANIYQMRWNTNVLPTWQRRIDLDYQALLDKVINDIQVISLPVIG